MRSRVVVEHKNCVLYPPGVNVLVRPFVREVQGTRIKINDYSMAKYEISYQTYLMV